MIELPSKHTTPTASTAGFSAPLKQIAGLLTGLSYRDMSLFGEMLAAKNQAETPADALLEMADEILASTPRPSHLATRSAS